MNSQIKSLKINQTINGYNYMNYYSWKLSHNILYNKYSSFNFSFSRICIHNLMFNEKCRIVSRFKDYLIYDDDTEFLRTHYKNQLLRKTLIKVFNFYDQFNKVFPNYMILPENVYMYKNLRKKQKMIDEYNRIMYEKKKRENDMKKNAKNNVNKIENINIFDESAKENINRQNNSMLTISLANTIISPYINNNDNKKTERILDNNSFLESKINSSISISLYTKRSFFNNDNNNNNHILYSDTLRSVSSLENVVNVLNNKKYKKIYINNNTRFKNKKYKLLNIDIFSNNNNNKKHNNNESNLLKSHLKTQNYIIKTPTKNKLFKKEKVLRQLYLFHQVTLNNNRKIFNHKKNTSDLCSLYPSIKHKVESLSKKKTFKYISKFHKEDNIIIEKISSSLIGKYKSKQRNKTKRRTDDMNGLIQNSISKKKEILTKSTDNYDHFQSKDKNSKDNKIIKVNNYFTFKRINKYSHKNNDLMKYNKIVKSKRKKIEEEEKNNDENNNKYEKIYEIFEEKFKSTLNNKTKGKHILDTDSTESTKLSFNNRKGKFNYCVTGDKINNNSNNQIYIYSNKIKTNKEALPTQPKEENSNNNNCNIANNVNTDINISNNYKYKKNLSKKGQNLKMNNIQNKKMLHKKHKTYSSQIDNNNDLLFSSVNKKYIMEENKINYLDCKLKKIKEEILKNKNNFLEIKEKYRKLSENNHQKIITYAQNTSQTKKYEKLKTCSLLHNNSVEKKERNYNNQNNNNKNNINNELLSRIKNKAVKKEKNMMNLHQRNYSLINNNFKSPFGKNIKKELTKEIHPKNKDKIISNKIIDKKIAKKIKKCN